MDPPFLNLVFIKGPREGETLEYKPGSTVRVGRIVRGNNLTIKDAGISEKHLRIWSDAGKWVVQDLGSSNGTFLNGSDFCLPADVPFDLRHGDTIKFGDYTSVQVYFTDDVDNGTDEEQEHKLPPRPRRNNRRQAVVDSDPVESVQEKPRRRGGPSKQGNREEVEVQELSRRGRVLRSRIVEDTREDVTNLEEKDEKKVNSRVGRTRKKEISENLCLDEKIKGTTGMGKQDEMQKEIEEARGNSRVRRNRKAESTQFSFSGTAKQKIEDITEGVEVLEGKDEKRVRPRGTRSKKIEIEKNSCLDFGNVEIGNTATEGAAEAPEKKDEKRVNLRVTRSKKNEIVQDSYLELEKVETEAKKRRRGRKKMEPKPLESNKAMAIEDNENTDMGEEAQDHTIEDDMESKQGLGLQEEYCDAVDKGREYRSKEAHSEVVNYSCAKEEGAKNSSVKGIDKVEVDLEKTALGEEAWNCSTKEDMENEQDPGLPEEYREAIDEGRDFRTEEGCSEAASDRHDKEEGAVGSGAKRVDQVGVDSEKMTLGEEAQNPIVNENIKKEQDLGFHKDYHAAIDKGREYRAKEASCKAANDGCDEEGSRGSATKSVKQMKVDLEKITLGEWFDFLEVSLPKQIMEETEKMIEAMRSKHKRVHEYIEEQKKEIGKKPVVK